MSTHKRIDRICVVAVVVSLVATILFWNGSALGLRPGREDEENSHITANDRSGDWDASAATRITLMGDGGQVSGNGAYVSDGDVHIVYAGKYVLSGELSDGSVIVDADGDDTIWILLDGVSLNCSDSAALRVEQADKVYLTLAEGSENTISTGKDYSDSAVDKGVDGAIYSRDDLTVNGSGSLAVTTEYRHGIVCNDSLVIAGGTIHVEATQDGIHANDSAAFANVDLTIQAGDDGITVSNDEGTGWIYVESGSVTIPACYEGLEATDITISGGSLDITPTDDGINANGGSSAIIRITGGDIKIVNPTGRDADGLDSNGSIAISGGNIFISMNGEAGSYAIDCGTENGGTCQISGGTVLACGSSGMAEGFDSKSEQAFLMHNTGSAASAGTLLSFQDSNGNTILAQTIPCGFSNVVLSTPEMKLGDTCTLTIGDAKTEVTIDNSSSSGFGGMGGHGMKGQQGMMPQQTQPGSDTDQAQQGGWPMRPNGMEENGQMPQHPDMQGNQFGGGRPGMFPQNGESQPARPDLQDGQPGGNSPELPNQNGDGQPTPPDLPAMDDNGQAVQPGLTPPENPQSGTEFTGRGEYSQNYGQSGQRGQNKGQNHAVQPKEDSTAQAVSSVQLALTGGSAVCLLAGIWFAVRKKY